MAPKKEKGGLASTNSKAWEPSLIAAHFNQVSGVPESSSPHLTLQATQLAHPPFQTPQLPLRKPDLVPLPKVLPDRKTQGPIHRECLTEWVLRKKEGSQCEFKQGLVGKRCR